MSPRLLSAAAALVLGACATPVPQTVVQTVKVPVRVACVDNVPTAPESRVDGLRAKGQWSSYEALTAALADLETLRADNAALRATLEACRG